MKTPQERYENDSRYHHFVDMVESMLHNAEFSPSEVREMTMLACIHHEYRALRHIVIPKEIETAIAYVEDWRTTQPRTRKK